MKYLSINIITLFIIAVTLISCNSERKVSRMTSEAFQEENEEELPYGVTDSIDGDKVSTQCAKMNYDLEQLRDRIEAVKSPDMLMHLRADFQPALDSLTSGAKLLQSDEKTIIDSDLAELKSDYAKVCKAYEIPADGVIANLEDCLKRVEAAQSQEEIERFIAPRSGMLNSLDIIYLCVEDGSPQIRNIRSLAHRLKNELYDKKVKFGML